MATPKERKQDMCPRCYLDGGKDEPLQYKLGSTQPLRCGAGHVFEDREELSTLSAQMNEARRIANPPPPPPPPQPVDESKLLESHPTDPIPTESAVKGIIITPIDFVRLSSLVGHFTDSSSLVGAVFALNQELQDTKELLRRAHDAKKVASAGSGPRKLAGDVAIEVLIPERHVGPIQDIAEANAMDISRYMNAKIEDGLDAMWYY